jgi:hypothetical protein
LTICNKKFSLSSGFCIGITKILNSKRRTILQLDIEQ